MLQPIRVTFRKHSNKSGKLEQHYEKPLANQGSTSQAFQPIRETRASLQKTSSQSGKIRAGAGWGQRMVEQQSGWGAPACPATTSQGGVAWATPHLEAGRVVFLNETQEKVKVAVSFDKMSDLFKELHFQVYSRSCESFNWCTQKEKQEKVSDLRFKEPGIYYTQPCSWQGRDLPPRRGSRYLCSLLPTFLI